ncbi:MAG TPA: transcriptional repressor [Firmicutes bacterium]|jgi:Fur family peroxide stress response transcriptional regulator|nr:transcriptional repressor [Bacillota bacterium]
MGISTEALMTLLKKNNIRPSYTRIKIMEYLTTRQSHPTADEIYSRLLPKIPTLSKTTVYNSLNTFAKAGLVKVLAIEDKELRFDADTSDHGHFKCGKCGRIFDFAVDLAGLHLQSALPGFKIKQRDVYFKGICPGCLDNK